MGQIELAYGDLLAVGSDGAEASTVFLRGHEGKRTYSFQSLPKEAISPLQDNVGELVMIAFRKERGTSVLLAIFAPLFPRVSTALSKANVRGQLLLEVLRANDPAYMNPNP